MNKIDIVAVAALFVLAFSLWTLPLQQDKRPFGEGDAAWHFSIGDYIASSDKPIYRLPFYVGQWYYGYNPALGPNAPEYPPSNHYNYALMQVAGGERFVPVLMYRAIASFLGVFAVYFLISRLYGTAAAIAASTGLVFSIRERLIFLWGQQPTLISIVFAPVTFYAYYRYLDGYFKNEKSVKYLYAAALLLASQYLLHIQGFFISAMVIAIFTLFMLLKHRKLPFVKSGVRNLAVIAVILAVVILPFIMIYLGTPQGGNPRDLSRLLRWGVDHSLVAGSYAPDFVTFAAEYPQSPGFNIGSLRISLFLILLLLGILFSLLKRGNRELLMLAWLVGIYVILHADIFTGVSVERAARMLVAEPPLFYSLIAIGAVSLVSFVKLPANAKNIAKFAMAAVVVLVIAGSSYAEARTTLSQQYQSIFRITPAQMELSDWMRSNLPEDAYVYYIPENRNFKMGTWQYAKLRWILAASQRHVASYTSTFANNTDVASAQFYFVFDYSDLAIILAAPPNPLQEGARLSASALEQFERQSFNISEAIYNQNNIRVYEVEREDFQ